MIGRSQGYLAATVCVLGFGACDAPEQASDLRPSGPPEVLTVLTATGDNGTTETATFCKPGDEKRPTLVPANPNGPEQVCSDTVSQGAEKVTDTFPVEWFVRIQFDELLDPDIEELTPILDGDGNPTGTNRGSLANTLPVTLTCGGAPVAYDGLYSPSGNSLSWPLGPSLKIEPSDTAAIATGTNCEITIKTSVVDKDGAQVPTAQLGPYAFQIAALKLTSTSPSAIDPANPPSMATTISASAPVHITFNAAIDASSLDITEVTAQRVTDCTGTDAVPVVPTISDTEDDVRTISIVDAAAVGDDAWVVGATYLLTIPNTASVTDLGGGTGAVSSKDVVLCFKTKA